MKTLVLAVAVMVLWQPLAPIRAITADFLHHTANLIHNQ